MMAMAQNMMKNPAMLQQAMSMMGGGAGGAPGGGAGGMYIHIITVVYII